MHTGLWDVNMTPTLGNLVDFVLFNRGDKTFIGYTESDIAIKLLNAIKSGTMYYSVGYDNIIDGMILATKHEDTKILFIDENLSMTKFNLQKFASRAKQDFAGYQLEWFKNGKHQMPNTDKVYAKLSA